MPSRRCCLLTQPSPHKHHTPSRTLLATLQPITANTTSPCRPALVQDPRVLQKLHRRVFLDKLTRDEATLYISFYVEAANRDAFMAGASCTLRCARCACPAAACLVAQLRERAIVA